MWSYENLFHYLLKVQDLEDSSSIWIETISNLLASSNWLSLVKMVLAIWSFVLIDLQQNKSLMWWKKTDFVQNQSPFVAGGEYFHHLENFFLLLCVFRRRKVSIEVYLTHDNNAPFFRRAETFCLFSLVWGKTKNLKGTYWSSCAVWSLLWKS